ncbi:MAG: NUDIX domain-containing protein [Acidimicrobiia bacterium]|nr:NUDIX domain-containing protein [Acidimicrobiia bacterium]
MPAPIDAATIVLLRDGDEGPEAFMLRRHAGASFMAGAWVFPGGKLESFDAAIPHDLVDDPDAPDLALRVAAARETFEEAGILLGRLPDGRHPTVDDLIAMDSEAARDRLNDRDDQWDWSEWLEAHGVVLEIGALGFASWWITPEAEPKRFDTRFYLAAVPPEQDARHDDVETSHSVWTTPAAALAAAQRGEAMVVPPTRKNLEALLSFPSVDAAIDHARSTPDPEPILPVVERRGDETWVTHPSMGELRIR